MLLCAEEDDLALVKWVHAARSRGLAPEVVTGVEHDDAPMLDALADPSSRLFVVLRSDSLDAARMREIKSAFAKHRSPRQRLFAMRVDYSAEVAIDRIVAELEDKPRARSETSMVLAFEDVTGPHRVVRAATGSVPTVDAALRIVERATEHEVTERVELDGDLGNETIPMVVAPAASPATAKPRRRWARAAAWIGGLGLAAAASGVAVMAASIEATDAVRGSSVAPADGSRTTEATPRRTAALANDDAAPIADDEEPVVVRVASDEPPPARVATPRRRAHERPHRASEGRAAAPSVEPPAPTTDAPTPAPVEHDAIPLEPAPLEPEPVAAEPAAAPP